MHNKKAGIAIEELSGLLTFMFVAVLVILFFLFVKFVSEKNLSSDVEGYMDMLDVNDALLYFLKKPTESNLGNDMADLILQSYIEEGDCSNLEPLVKDYFNNIYGPTNTPWNFEILTPSDRPVLFTGGGIQEKSGGYRASRLTVLEHSAVVTIPSHGTPTVDYLKIRFSSGTLKPES
ncbi:MAG: hypothetical protein ACFFG0_24625 [Candidatus Thorarchaeota archaeon]